MAASSTVLATSVTSSSERVLAQYADMANPARQKSVGSILTVIQSAVTIGAILIGGLWTYNLFVQQRQKYAHLKIEHKVTHLSLPDHRILLMVEVTHTNVGSVKVSLASADVRVYNLQPQELTDEAITQINQGKLSDTPEPNTLWQIVAHPTTSQKDDFVVEPGESDQIHYEFVLSDDVGPLVVYTYFKNPTIKHRDIGWVTRSIYDPRKRPEPTIIPR
jgi:hypothetical protein